MSWKLLQGDCLEIMPTLPDKSVDFAFADPPYGINKAEWDGRYISGYEKELLRVSRGGVAITPGHENIEACIKALGEEYKGIVAARNLNGMTFSRVGFGNWTPIIVGGNIKRGQDYFEFVVKGEKPDHPSPKPIQFMTKLILRFTDHGDTILDPFAGSGTTGIVAESQGRNSIMIEIDPDYCALIRRRMANRQITLFEKGVSL